MRKNHKRKPAQKKPNPQPPVTAKPNEINPLVPGAAEAVSSAPAQKAAAEPAAEPKTQDSALVPSKPEETKLVETKPQQSSLTQIRPVETKMVPASPANSAQEEKKASPEVKSETTEPAVASGDASAPAPEEQAPKKKTASTRTRKAKAEPAAPDQAVKKPAARKPRAASAKTRAAKADSTADKSADSAVGKPAEKPVRKRAVKPSVDEGAEFMVRFERHVDELKWLYMELYNDERLFDELNANLNEIYKARRAPLKELDRAREGDPEWFRRGDRMGMLLDTGLFAGNLSGVSEHLDYLKDLHVNHLHLTPLLKTPLHNSDDGFTVSDYRTVREDLGNIDDLEQLAELCHKKKFTLALDFTVNHTSSEHEWARRAQQGEAEYAQRYINNWNLNYRNPVVFNEMAYHLLFLANAGVDAIQLHDLHLLNTRSHSFPKVHNVVRMLRILCEIVCPGVLLLCSNGMSPQDAQSYLGTPDKPECHMLYNTLVASSIWNALATRDTRLLKGELDNLPQGVTYLNALRTYDPLRWEMSDDPLSWLGFDPYLHREFLFSFFDGSYPGSFARGAQYHNYEDDGSCGTTASFCGVEKALKEQDERELQLAVSRDLMLHTLLLTLPGLPTLYSGDEVGQLNQPVGDGEDTRLAYRAPFDWTLAQQRTDPSTVAGKLFPSLRALKDIRAKHPDVFADAVPYSTVETGDISTLSIVRGQEGETLQALFNFCEEERTVTVEPGNYTDLLTRKKSKGGELTLAPYQAMWLCRKV